MGQGDRFTRRTRPFDSKRLVELSKKDKPAAGELGDLEEELGVAPEPMPDPEQLVLQRATTVHDPLTTQLLAEVARRSQTMDVEAEAQAAQQAAEEQGSPDSGPTPSPIRKPS